jgi:hypothetical protein
VTKGKKKDKAGVVRSYNAETKINAVQLDEDKPGELTDVHDEDLILLGR